MTDLTGPYALTYTGRRVYFHSPAEAQIHPDDLAHHLSLIPRYNGATQKHYSVAQHSVLVAKLLDSWNCHKKTVLGGLLHDAPEFVIGDLISPFKAALSKSAQAEIKEIEKKILIAIYARAGLDWLDPVLDDDHWSRIHEADMEILARERTDLMPQDALWNLEADEDISPISPWPTAVAEEKFRHLYVRLTRAIR